MTCDKTTSYIYDDTTLTQGRLSVHNDYTTIILYPEHSPLIRYYRRGSSHPNCRDIFSCRSKYADWLIEREDGRRYTPVSVFREWFPFTELEPVSRRS